MADSRMRYLVTGVNCYVSPPGNSTTPSLDSLDYLSLYPFLPSDRHSVFLAARERFHRGSETQSDALRVVLLTRRKNTAGLRRYLAYPASLGRLIQAVTLCDRVYVRLPAPYGWVTLLIARLLRKPHAISLHGRPRWTRVDPSLLGAGYARVAALVSKVALRGVGLTFTTSGDLPSVYRVDGPAIEYRSTVVKTVPELPPFQPPKQSTVRLLYVGRLTADKNPLAAIEVADRLRKRGLEAEVSIVGEGPQWDLIEAEATRRGIRIKMFGFISDHERLATVYREHDYMLLDSAGEGSPKVLLEAMMNGTVVVTWPASSSILSLVDHDSAILASSHKNYDEYAELIARTHATPRYGMLRKRAWATASGHTIESLREQVQTAFMNWESP